jgi:hypothetical protein
MPGWAGYLRKLAGDGRMKSTEARAAYALANALQSRGPNLLEAYSRPASVGLIEGIGGQDPEALRRQALIEALLGKR